MWGKNTRLALQFASVLTAGSFLASALVYCLIFAIWGLDFTALANADDVVMGGIRLVSFVLAVGLVLFIYRLAEELDALHQVKKSGRYRMRGIIFAFGIAAIFFTGILTAGSVMPTVLLSLGISDEATHIFRERGWFIFLISQILMATMIAGLVRLIRGGSIRDAAACLIRGPRTSSFIFVGTVSIMVMIGFSLGHYEGLTISGGVQLPAQCVSSPGEIRWIGSRSIIMTCGEETFVFANNDEIILSFGRAPGSR